MDQKHLEILYDHYKESNQLSLNAQAGRNRYFLLLCILEAFAFWTIVNPDYALTTMLQAIITKTASKDLILGNNVLQTLLWLLIVYVTIRYVQSTLYVERQYVYLANLEKGLSDYLAPNTINREGENYAKDYPMVLNFIDLFYKMCSPILFLVINTVHIAREVTMATGWPLSLICDLFLYVALFIIVWFYFFEIHDKITGFFKKCCLINGLASFLRDLLKHV